MIENEQIRDEFCRILEEQAAIGIGRIISDWFFEPPNIFSPNVRRNPKPSVVIVWSYLILMAVAWTVFNFR